MQHHDYDKILFQGTVTAGGATVDSDVLTLPEGLILEKVGLWVYYTPADPANILTVADLWTPADLAPPLPPFVGASATTTSSCVFTICNPGGGRALTIQLSSSGSGDDFVGLYARAVSEP